MSQAVEDGATVKIFYESRVIPLELPEGLSIDEDYEGITEDQETLVKEKLKSKWSRLEAIAGAESRVKRWPKILCVTMRNVKSDVWEIDDCRYVTSYCNGFV